MMEVRLAEAGVVVCVWITGVYFQDKVTMAACDIDAAAGRRFDVGSPTCLRCEVDDRIAGVD